MKKINKYRHLSFEERFLIDKLHSVAVAIREIAKFLKRSPNTVSREIRKNSVKGEYEAEKANKKARTKRWRAKRNCLKVSMDKFLAVFVKEKLEKKWSPEQISGHLKEEMKIICSAKAIYKFASSRGFEHLLFWGWNNQKGGPKKYKYDNPKDERKYIELRSATDSVGHFEMDFIVSKQSSFVFLVVVDRVSKKTFLRKLPNRKRATVLGALSELFDGREVKSITTDNDIAFVCWKEIEALLNTQIYFTHPYHSWEKGLVENTNRWIRCFVPKKKDIQLVTEEEMQEILSFLNDRPRAVKYSPLPQ
jgi:IS30 family transposase